MLRASPSIVLLALSVTAAACAGTESQPPTNDATGSTTDGSTGAAASTMTPDPDSSEAGPGGDPTGAVTTVTPGTTDEGGSSTTESFPPGPPCSVQEVTEGALVDPLERGEEAGKFPPIVADTLEDYCGCHTLQNNAQNLKFMFLKAPGGSLFLNHGDVSGGLGQSMSTQVLVDKTMPPGSCFYPDEPAAILEKWFLEGLPDGATFVYP